MEGVLAAPAATTMDARVTLTKRWCALGHQELVLLKKYNFKSNCYISEGRR